MDEQPSCHERAKHFGFETIAEEVAGQKRIYIVKKLDITFTTFLYIFNQAFFKLESIFEKHISSVCNQH